MIVRKISQADVALYFFKASFFNLFVRLLYLGLYWQVVRHGLTHFWKNAALLKRCKALDYRALIQNYSQKCCTGASQSDKSAPFNQKLMFPLPD